MKSSDRHCFIFTSAHIFRFRVVFIWLACSVLLISNASPAGAEENELVIISPHWEGIKHETERAFSRWHQQKYGQPVSIRWRDIGGGATQIVRFIQSEFAQRPGGIGIDIFYGGGVDPYLELKESHSLQRWHLPEEIRAAIPQKLGGINIYDPDEEWFGSALSGFGILTNEKIRTYLELPAVRTWADLASPRLSGWVSAGDPRQSGSVLAMYEIILQAYGWERGWAIIAGLSGNVRSFLTSGAAPAKEASFGEIAFAMAVDIYGFAQVAHVGPDAMTFTLPEDAAVISPDAVAIIKNPPHPQLTEHFLEWLLGREGQLLWMLPRGVPGGAERFEINRMSVMPALYEELKNRTPVQTDPFKQKLNFVFNSQISSQRRAILASLIGAVFIDLQSEVRATWNAIQKSSQREALTREFESPPVSEQQLLDLAKTDWKNPELKNRLINQWQNEQGKKLRSLRQRALAAKSAAK